MKQFISWAIIKRVTESESILIKRGIEAHFRARLQPYRAVMVKSLYTLRLSSGYNDLLNSENLKVDIGKLCHDIEVCNFTLL